MRIFSSYRELLKAQVMSLRTVDGEDMRSQGPNMALTGFEQMCVGHNKAYSNLRRAYHDCIRSIPYSQSKEISNSKPWPKKSYTVVYAEFVLR